MVLKSPEDQLTGPIVEEEDGGAGENRATEDDDSSRGVDRDRDSVGGRSDRSGGRWRGRKAGGAAGRVPFVLLLKKATDLVLQPFQVLQVRMLAPICLHNSTVFGGIRTVRWAFQRHH